MRKKAAKAFKPWVAAIQDCAPGASGECPLTLTEYLQLVDVTARKVRKGKRGAMDRQATDILERLGLDGEKWVEAMARGGRFRGRAIGSNAARAEHLAQHGNDARWIADKTPLYAGADGRGG